MRIVITGGHLNPALCVIDEFPKDTEILMVGRKYGIEGDKALSLEYLNAKSLKISFKSVTTGRFQRKFTKHTIFSFFKIPLGFYQSFLILREFKPDVILTFGGYIALPIAVLGFFLRIPVVLHEQTLGAGLTNRIISIFAKKVCISWESSRKFFPPSKVVLTGNPVRKFHPPAGGFKFPILNERLPLIYITGGSLGSHAINLLIESCIKRLLEKFRVIHQTGDAKEFLDFDRLVKFRQSLDEKSRNRYEICKFVDPKNVGSIINMADLVVSRSGINTVTELIFFKKPSLLIPLPFSQNHEQIKNAMFFKDLGLGEYFYQKDLTPDKLYQEICLMYKNLEKYKLVKNDIIMQDTAKRINNILKKIA